MKAVDLNRSIRERLFLKKVAEFLLGTADVSEEDKEKIKNNIHLEEGFAQKVGQNLMLLLERHESFEKSFLLGKAFALYIKNGIDYETFQRVSKFTSWQDDIFFIGFLNEYPEYQTQGMTKEELIENLKDLLIDFESGQVPYIRKVEELLVA